MKTAEEVAGDFLYAHGHNRNWGLETCVQALARALNAFSDERVADAVEKIMEKPGMLRFIKLREGEAVASHVFDQKDKIRTEALEQAAKIADTYCLNVSDDPDCYAALIARKIRALKDKPSDAKLNNDINHKDYDKNNVGG